MNRFISAKQLKASINPSYVLIDCRAMLGNSNYGMEEYKKGHLPGAYFLSLDQDLSGPLGIHGGRHPLPDPILFKHKLEKMGITPQSTIILYDDSAFSYAARAWWLIQRLGLNNIVFLNGGFAAWQAEGFPIDKREPAQRQGFIPTHASDPLIDREFILNNIEALSLIDSREPIRFNGEYEPIDPIAGHIPQASNYFWKDCVDENGFFKDISYHQTRWQHLEANKTPVVYCGSGITACVNLLSLEAAGINAKLYPGSWSDWCSYLTQSSD